MLEWETHSLFPHYVPSYLLHSIFFFCADFEDSSELSIATDDRGENQCNNMDSYYEAIMPSKSGETIIKQCVRTKYTKSIIKLKL